MFSDISSKFKGLLLPIRSAFKKVFNWIKRVDDILLYDFSYMLDVKKTVEDDIKKYQRLGLIEKTDTDKINQLSHYLETYETYRSKASKILLISIFSLFPIIFLFTVSELDTSLQRLLVFFSLEKG